VNMEQETKQIGPDWWSWAVWLDGAPGELDLVEKVTYYLHPTFPEPVQIRTSRQAGFRIEGKGWGEFTVRARVDVKDGRHEIFVLPLRFGSSENRIPLVPTLFISHSLVDAEAAQTVRHALTDELRLKFVEPEPEPGLGISIESQIQDSDALIAIFSDERSLWVERDIDTAEKLGVPIVPVVVGSFQKLPGHLAARSVIRLDEVSLASSLKAALRREHVIAGGE
jgi:hypothetical protein